MPYYKVKVIDDSKVMAGDVVLRNFDLQTNMAVLGPPLKPNGKSEMHHPLVNHVIQKCDTHFSVKEVLSGAWNPEVSSLWRWTDKEFILLQTTDLVQVGDSIAKKELVTSFTEAQLNIHLSDSCNQFKDHYHNNVGKPVALIEAIGYWVYRPIGAGFLYQSPKPSLPGNPIFAQEATIP